MTTFIPVFTIVGGHSPKTIARKILESPRFKKAAEAGHLVDMAVRFSTDDETKGIISTRWANPNVLQGFLAEHPKAFKVFKINGENAIRAKNSEIYRGAQFL